MTTFAVMRKIKFTIEQTLEIESKYKAGFSSTELALLYDVSTNTMLRLLNSIGITRSHLDAHNIMAASVNHTFFDVIDTPSKAWCLGVMFSDGNIDKNENLINICMCDLDVIEKFKECLEYKGRIDIVKVYSRKHKQPYRLLISSNQLNKSLISHGCIPAKSLTLQFPTTIPDHLLPHFIRGYFDGDGCVYVPKDGGNSSSASFQGNEVFIMKLKEVLEQNGIKCSYYRDKRANDSCDARVSKKPQMTLLHDYMYKDSSESTRMERKYQMFTNYIKSV